MEFTKEKVDDMMSDLDVALEDLSLEVFINDLLMRADLTTGIDAYILGCARKRTASFISDHVKNVRYEVNELRRGMSVGVAERIQSA